MRVLLSLSTYMPYWLLIVAPAYHKRIENAKLRTDLRLDGSRISTLNFQNIAQSSR
jgi:hypothetical protein